MLTLWRVTFQLKVQVTSSIEISKTKYIDILHKRKQTKYIDDVHKCKQTKYIDILHEHKQNKQEKIK